MMRQEVPIKAEVFGLRDVLIRPAKEAKGPKGRHYWNLSVGLRFRRFKWQWKVQYEVKDKYAGWNMHDGLGGASYPRWLPEEQLFDSRSKARQFIRQHQNDRRNFKMQRRLVEVDWHEYKDSFGWNSGCGKR